MPDDPTTPLPWERRDDESAAQWQGFCAYRDLGAGRTLELAFADYKDARGIAAVSMPGYFRSWCAGHAWVARCEAYDAHLIEERRERRERQRAALEDAEYDRAMRLLREFDNAAAALDDFARRLDAAVSQDGRSATVTLDVGTGRELARWLDDISKIARRSMGMPERITSSEVTGKDGGPVETYQLTAAELAMLKPL